MRLVAAWALLAVVAASHANELPTADKVVVIKSERTLVLLRDGEPLRRYEIRLGARPEGHKEREGDERTPEGRYVLDWRNPDSRFYRSIHISYPSALDRAWARSKGFDPGGDVMIHGEPAGGPLAALADAGFDWTDGCIAVANEQMDEIWEAVPNGTPIEIRP